MKWTDKENTRKQYRGFWLKLAENQKLRKENQRSSPAESTVPEQTYCKVKLDDPSTLVATSTSDVPEVSIPVKTFESENNESSKPTQITPGIQLGPGQSLYKE